MGDLLSDLDIVPEREDYSDLIDNPEFDDSIPVYSSVEPSGYMTGLLSEDLEDVGMALIAPVEDVDEFEYFELEEDLDSDGDILEDLEDYENPAVYIGIDES